MNVTEHQRPGVYSVYDASSAVSGRTGGRAAPVVGVSAAGAGTLHTITGYDQAAAALGKGDSLTELVKLLFANGAGKVYAVPVAAPGAGEDGLEGYQDAFDKLEKLEDIAVAVCDSTAETVQQAMKESVNTASRERKERLAVLPCAGDETAAQAAARAEGLNSERVVLVHPGGARAAAAAAGAIAGESDPAMPLGGAELKGLGDLDAQWSDNDIDVLVLGGVTPLERSGGAVSVVRAVTTRTKTGGAGDATWRELSTIRIVDDVIPTLRRALRAKFGRAKNTEQGRGAIRSQVIVELEAKLADEIITGYDGVTVTAVEGDPTVCLVEFRFNAAHGLNQIWLSAHITV